MIQVYGVPMSRAFRPLWMLQELGLPHENVPTHFANGDNKKPEYLALNPNGHIPTLVDGDVVLWESIAINLYLAKRYHKSGLWPKSVADEGRVYQWSFWAITEVEEPLLTYLMHSVMLPKEQRDAAKVRDAQERLAKPLGVLEGALSGRQYLVGNGFGVADLNVASVLSWARMVRLDLSKWPGVDAWLTRCLDRPASKKASGRA